MLPNRYSIDPDTNLGMNTPAQWSKSPYLGAIWNKTLESYTTQISIPTDIWKKLVLNNQNRWLNAPTSLIHKNYIYLRQDGYSDPRQAAWVMQEVLYSENVDVEEIVEDYLEMKYCGGKGELWKDILDSVPTFDNEPLRTDQADEFFSKIDPTVREKMNKIKKNTELFDERMTRKLKLEFDRTQHTILSEYDVDVILEEYGIEYFLVSPGSVKLKDLTTLNYPDVI